MNARQARIIVVGDIMLDTDTFFESVRISAEGVPVVNAVDQQHRLGGAGAVAVMAAALGCDVYLAGAIGCQDENTEECVRRLIAAAGVRDCTMSCDRPQTHKSRAFVDGDQVFRIDEESTEWLPAEETACLIEELPAVDDEVHEIVLVADYGKGVVTEWILDAIADRKPHMLIIDPASGRNWGDYPGALMVPNINEWAAVGGGQDATLNYRTCIIKLGRYGIRVDNTVRKTSYGFPAHNIELADVCGAGDMVLAALGVSLAYSRNHQRNISRSIAEDVQIANLAAALKCEKIGAVPITPEELINGCNRFAVPVPFWLSQLVSAADPAGGEEAPERGAEKMGSGNLAGE